MLSLTFGGSVKNARRILCLGAHSDDIEIGCGGTILKLAESRRPPEVTWVVFSSGPERDREAHESAGLFLKGIKKRSVIVKNFRNGFFPYVAVEIKEFFEELKNQLSPDLIFTHYRHDLHQDHRLLCDLTWNTFRNHLILEYEIPKYDGDLGSPNCFIPLDRRLCQRKTKFICRVFGTQRNKHWFSPDTFEALMRLRGVESAAPEKYAEAFYCRKLLLDSFDMQSR
jgi:LmbE family N-acetylglucosaminyl deacetylase